MFNKIIIYIYTYMSITNKSNKNKNNKNKSNKNKSKKNKNKSNKNKSKKNKNKSNKNKSNKNKSKKNKNKSKKNKISLRTLKIGYPLYAAKVFDGNKILEYNRKIEQTTGDHCHINNIGWFGEIDVAKNYKTKDTNIYKFEIKNNTNLLNINKVNEKFLKHLFKNTKKKLIPSISLTSKQVKKIDYEHPYINMNNNEKSYYEFCFAFGYLNIQEQYNFLNLIKYLIKNNFIEIKRRSGDSIIKKIDIKINYYRANIFLKKQKYNRISFYLFDKHALINLCRIVRNSYSISGIY
jgi:hypothetical protein